jgi:RNA polymerase sigma factor (sigma-70 family)
VRLLFEKSKLSERQERVVRLRLLHGLELKEVAEQFGVSIARVRQIECKAMQHMKRAATALRKVGAI